MFNNTTEREIMESLADPESRRVTEQDLFQDNFNIQKYPDAKKHQIVSFIKSGVRILGYILIPFDLVSAAIILVASEVIGIIEELV